MIPGPSKLDLAAACSYPWSSGMRWPKSTPSEHADLGTAVHRALAEYVQTGAAPTPSDPAALALYLSAVARLEDEPPWTNAELPVALDPVLMSARVRSSRDDWSPGETLGELDLVRVEGERVTIRDWKTGRRARDRRVQDTRQLRWYAVVASHIWPGRRVRVELATITEEAVTIDAYEADEWDLGAWEADLLSVYDRARSASLPVVGPHCRESYCPIVATCPAVARHVVEASGAAGAEPLRVVTDDASARVAALALPALEAYLEAVRDSLRAHVATSPVVLEDGRRLALVEQPGARRIELDDAAEAYLEQACGSRDVIERSATFASIRRAVSAGATKRGEIGRRTAEIEQRLTELGAVRQGSGFTKMQWSKP